MPQLIAYRLTLYAGGLHSTDNTALTPAAGAPHSDAFKISTIAGVSGFQPYLNGIKGKRGTSNVPSQQLEVGRYMFSTIDKRTTVGGTNLERWVTAFFGNSTGVFTLVGRKCYVEESVDGGSSWSPFFVGAVSSVNLQSPLRIEFEVKDSLDVLQKRAFTSTPRVPYVVYNAITPIGLLAPLESDASASYIGAPAGLQGYKDGATANAVGIRLSSAALNRKDNVYPATANFALNLLRNFDLPAATAVRDYNLRAQIIQSGSTYEYAVNRVNVAPNWNKTNFAPVRMLYVSELPTTDPQYTPLSSIAADMLLYTKIYRSYATTIGDDAKRSDTSIFLNAKPLTILADMLDGKFFPQSGSLASTRVTYDSSSLAAIETARPLPLTIFRVDSPEKAVEWMEANVLKPFSIGYTAEAYLSGSVPTSRIRFFDTTVPTTLSGSVTLTEADIDTSVMPTWNAGLPVSTIEARHYAEVFKEIDATKLVDTDLAGELLSTSELVTVDKYVNSRTNTEYSTLAVDFKGIRALLSDAQYQEAGLHGISAITAARFRAQEYATYLHNRYGAGSPTVILDALRNVRTDALRVGDFCLVEADMLPNQATHTRGGTRVMQVLGKHPMGLRYELELLDSGINSTMANPIVGTPTSPADNTVSVYLETVGPEALVSYQVAVTDVGGAQPSSADMRWMTAGVQLINGSVTVTIPDMPETKRVWVRARTTSPTGTEIRLPSAWVVGGYIDLTNLSAPTSVSVVNINSRSAKVVWANTEPLSVEVWLASPAGTPTTLVAALPPSSSVYQLNGLDKSSSTSHRVGIRYNDTFRGSSAFATADFTATGTAVQLDAPAAHLIYSGY